MRKVLYNIYYYSYCLFMRMVIAALSITLSVGLGMFAGTTIVAPTSIWWTLLGIGAGLLAVMFAGGLLQVLFNTSNEELWEL